MHRFQWRPSLHKPWRGPYYASPKDKRQGTHDYIVSKIDCGSRRNSRPDSQFKGAMMPRGRGRLRRSDHCVQTATSFWAGGEETAADGLLNECKRLLGFACLRLGC